jgi:hypothetical protein
MLMSGEQVARWVGRNGGGQPVIVRRIAQQSPGRVSWEVHVGGRPCTSHPTRGEAERYAGMATGLPTARAYEEETVTDAIRPDADLCLTLDAGEDGPTPEAVAMILAEIDPDEIEQAFAEQECSLCGGHRGRRHCDYCYPDGYAHPSRHDDGGAL